MFYKHFLHARGDEPQGTSSGFVVGIGMAGDGDLGIGRGYSSQQTQIAKQTAPPEKQGDSQLIVVSILSLIVWIIAAAFLFQMFSFVVAGPASIIILVALVVASNSWWKKRGPKMEAAYKAALMKWEHSWICHKCGNTYYVR